MERNSLDHVEDAFILVEPNVVVGNGDILKGDLFGVLEKGIGPPHGIEPGGGQQPVVGCQVVREPQSIILPRLREEDVGRKRLDDEHHHTTTTSKTSEQEREREKKQTNKNK